MSFDVGCPYDLEAHLNSLLKYVIWYAELIDLRDRLNLYLLNAGSGVQ